MGLADEGRRRPRAVVEQDPVREFMGDPLRLSGTLLNMLRSERAVAASALITGGPQNFAEYRNRVGFVEGLDTAIALCEQAQKQL
jgi:hypothetical protein